MDYQLLMSPNEDTDPVHIDIALSIQHIGQVVGVGHASSFILKTNFSISFILLRILLLQLASQRIFSFRAITLQSLCTISVEMFSILPFDMLYEHKIIISLSS